MPSEKKKLTFASARSALFWVSAALVVISLTLIGIFGLNYGIDFTGGSSLQVLYSGDRPSTQDIQDKLAPLNFGEVRVQPAGDQGAVIKTRHLTDEERQQVLEKLGDPTEELFSSVGPTIGKELRNKAFLAIGIVLIAIILYISWAFRGVSVGPIKSWVYGIGAIVALVHDIVIPTAVFAVLGKVLDVQIDTLFVTALLTILGFSVHDTIVVYDRIRETLKRKKDTVSFEEIVDQSVRSTMVRSLNTSITTAFVLSTLLLFGGSTTFYFVLTLLIGIICGTYSSIFVASPLLVLISKLLQKRKKA